MWLKYLKVGFVWFLANLVIDVVLGLSLSSLLQGGFGNPAVWLMIPVMFFINGLVIVFITDRLR